MHISSTIARIVRGALCFSSPAPQQLPLKIAFPIQARLSFVLKMWTKHIYHENIDIFARTICDIL
jgi:hypothetical protein